MKNLFLIILLFQVPGIFGQVDWTRTNTCEYKNFNNEDLIEQLISGMTIEEKVGQVIQGDLDFISPQDVKKFKTDKSASEYIEKMHTNGLLLYNNGRYKYVSRR